MTTIATDGKSVASDSLRVCGSERVDECTRKIRKVDGVVYAFTGDFAAFAAAIDWHKSGAVHGDAPKAGKDGSWRLLIMGPDEVTSYVSDLPYPEPYPYPQAFGSGAGYAMAALKLGKSSREAIELAKELDVFTGGPVFEIAIERTKLAEAAE
jgi:ATP-dependent protease HslVU (ClpYQ) peptidase subunit